MAASGIAYGFIPFHSCGDDANGNPLPACSSVTSGAPCCTKASNMGWRYTLLCIGAICIFIFFLRFVVFRFQESPKFLLYRGRDSKAVEVLHKIAKFNGRESTVTVEVFEALNDEASSTASGESDRPMIGASTKKLKESWGTRLSIELQRYKILFSTFTMARLTLLVWITYVRCHPPLYPYNFMPTNPLSPPAGLRLLGLQHSRLLPPQDSPRQELCHRRLRRHHLSQLRHHLHLRHPRRPPRHPHVQRPPRRPQMGHGRLLRPHGPLPLPLRDRKHRSLKHRTQRHGISLPEYVQCRALWLDAGSVSDAD